MTRESAEELAGLQRDIESIPSSPALQKFQQAQGFGEAFKAIAESPVETISELMAESLGSLVPKAVKTMPQHIAAGAAGGAALGAPFAGVGAGPGALLGARAGLISGTAVTSYSLEYAGKVLESLQERGVNIKDPDQIQEAFSNPVMMDEIRDKAVKKGVPIAAFDAFSALIGGRLISKPARTILGKAGQLATEVGTQAGLGMAGETSGELAAGEKLSPASILAEGLIEIPGGAPEIAIGALTERRTRPTESIRRPYDTERAREILPPEPQREEPRRTIPVEEAGGEAAPPGRVLQTSPELEPEFPLRRGTQGTPWEDQRGRPVRQEPDPEKPGAWRWRVVPQEAPGEGEVPIKQQAPPEKPPVTEKKVAPVEFLQVQPGMPELGWYRLTGDVVRQDGFVYPAGKNISSGELERFGYTIPDSEMAKYQGALQGELRRPQQESSEGKTIPIPATPPAIEIIGETSVPEKRTPAQAAVYDQIIPEIHALNKRLKGAPIRRVVLTSETPGTMETRLYEGGFDTIYVNPAEIEKQGLLKPGRKKQFKQWIRAALSEEMKHNAAAWVAYDKWKQSRQGSFSDFYTNEMLGIHGEMTPEQRANVKYAYGGEMTERQVGEEFLRMIVQQRMNGITTEEVNLGAKTIAYLRDMLNKLIELYQSITDPDSKSKVQHYAEAVQSILNEQTAREPAERFEEFTNEATGTQNLRWNPGQSQDGFGLIAIAALNNPAADPLRMPGKINPQQLVNRLKTILPPQEWDWYQKAGIEELAQNRGATAQDFINFIQQNGPKVEVKELLATPIDNAINQEYASIIHELDSDPIQGLSRPDELPSRQSFLNRVNIGRERYYPNLTDKQLELVKRLHELEPKLKTFDNSDSATARYTMVNPKPLDQMPGAVDILVRVPFGEKAITKTPTEHGTVSVRTEHQGQLFRGSHFRKSDVNILGWVRGYMETLPDGRKTFHIFEVQSDWGQKLREHQEMARQRNMSLEEYKRWYKETTIDHPLLRDYNRLALKAAIKHALDNGADSITISDAETAMMTEGHDTPRHDSTEVVVSELGPERAGREGTTIRPHTGAAYVYFNQPFDGSRPATQLDFDRTKIGISDSLSEFGQIYIRRFNTNEEAHAFAKPLVEELNRHPRQEPGMRLNYDKVLPQIAKELTGYEGVRVDLGEHKNALTNEGEPFGGGRYGETIHPVPRPDLIFKNQDGTPKTSITGREYDLTAVRNRLAQTGGVFPLFGGGKFVQPQAAVATGTMPVPEEQPAEESPFDRMRREAGLGPKPPEPTPEETRQRELKERQRGMRRDPRIAGTMNPAERAAAENGDELWEHETNRMGETDIIRGREYNTQQSTELSREHAGRIIREAGMEAQPDLAVGGWRFTGGRNEVGGRRLVELIKRELSTPDSAQRDNATLLPSLLNSVRMNYGMGLLNDIVDAPTGRELYGLTQGEASHRGRSLQALQNHPVTIDFVGQHIDAILQRVYYDALGGRAIEQVMDEMRYGSRGIQAFFSLPVVQQVLAQHPNLQAALNNAQFAAEAQQKQVPDAATLIREIFQTPFYRTSNFSESLQKRLIEQYGVDAKEAANIAKRFQEAFAPSLKQAAEEALKIAAANLSFKQKAGIKSKKSIERIVQEAIHKGSYDTGDILREIAKEHGWRPPSDADMNKMKALARRILELKTLPPEVVEEMKKFNASPEELEKRRQIREASLSGEINRLRRELETEYARMVKPINIPGFNPSSWNPAWKQKGNLAAAINEFISANLLLKLGFGPRQAIAILSQWAYYIPTRAVANAMVNLQHGQVMNWQGRQGVLKEVASSLRDGYKQQFAAMRSALAAAQASFLGRGESRNVEQLMSGLHTLDRLTRQAEEYYNNGDYARAGLLYFMSMVKWGYRIAQGMDRLQGVPAEQQNLSQQVMRGLMDMGKTRAEAEHSRDQVLGDMNRQWLEAIPIAKMWLESEGIELSPQAIRQAAGNIVKRRQYQRIQALGLPADDFERENLYHSNTIGWNQREAKGIGGAIARGMRQVERVFEEAGIPLVVTRFSNAIGTTINRSLANTIFWKQANVGPGGDSPWFKSEADKAQRKVEGIVGSGLGAIALAMAWSGLWVVRTKWPKDKEERELWEREGHRPNTVEIPVGDGEFIPISLNNSPLMFVAPYLAAGGALREKAEERDKKQAKADAEAAKLGITAERVPGLDAADLGAVAMEAFKQSVLGGRTAAGLVSSVTQYGVPSAKKTTANYVSALIPGMPGAQEVMRMSGVNLDDKLATVGDFILPLPTSQARKVNLLGDAVKTPDDVQRVMQILTGGTYPGIVDTNRAKDEAAYGALFASGYRPPAVNPAKGYNINGVYRPMNESELVKFTQARGQYLKQGLAALGPTATKETASAVYKMAEQRALSDAGVTTAATIKPPRAPKPPRLTTTQRGGGIRRVRQPGYGRLRMRRIRPLSRRRVRRLAA